MKKHIVFLGKEASIPSPVFKNVGRTENLIFRNALSFLGKEMSFPSVVVSNVSRTVSLI